MELRDYLDAGAEKLGGSGKLCDELGITRAALSMARKNGSMSSDHCVELAGILEINPGKVLKAADLARNPDHGKYWAVASVILTVAAGSQVVDSATVFTLLDIYPAIYYAKLWVFVLFVILHFYSVDGRLKMFA